MIGPILPPIRRDLSLIDRPRVSRRSSRDPAESWPPPYTIHAGDRIAQMIVARYEPVDWLEGDLADSVRGAGWFGSSGR
jgi:hypothetical protein